jgi:hypothetical protein
MPSCLKRKRKGILYFKASLTLLAQGICISINGHYILTLKYTYPRLFMFRFNFFHLPLHCWTDNLLRVIGNTLGKYIDKSEQKIVMFSCAII